MSISIDDQTKVATQVLGLQLAQDMLKKVVGSDGTEFELMYQALIENFTSDPDNSVLGSVLNTSSSSGNSSEDLDSLKKLLELNANLNSSKLNEDSLGSISGSNSDINSVVEKYSEKYGVDSKLVLAVIQAESNFDSTATSSVGATGLMQIMPSNYDSLGITDGYDIEQNINGGVKLLKEYLDMYDGDTSMALAAYNAGPGTLSRRGVTSSNDLYKLSAETQNYVPKVLAYYNAA